MAMAFCNLTYDNEFNLLIFILKKRKEKKSSRIMWRNSMWETLNYKMFKYDN